MLLTEIITSSTSAIKKRRTVIESKQNAETYAKALAQLSQTAENIQNTLDCAVTMKEKGIVNTPLMDESTRSDLLSCIDDCGRDISEMKLTLTTVKILKSKGDMLATQINAKWRETAQQYSDGPKGYLSMIGGLLDDPKQAKELEDRITKTVSRDPSKKSINDLVLDVAEARKIADEFSLNPEIESFLKKVSSQRATVLDLTPDILDWLKEKGLTNRLKIRF